MRRPESVSPTVHRSILLGASLLCIVVAAVLLHLASVATEPSVVRRCAVYAGCVGNAFLCGLVWVGTGWWRLAGIGLMAPTMWLVLGAHEQAMRLAE